MKILMRVFGGSIFALTLILLVFIADNNVGKSSISAIAVDHAYQKAINWLENNRDEVYSQHNAPLWWMLRQSQLLNHHRPLDQFVQQYINRYHGVYGQSPWRYLIDDLPVNVNAREILSSNLADYNQYFVYAFSCNKALETSAIVEKQKDEFYCLKHQTISPACLTHQMMGVRFMQRNHCGDPVKNKQLVDRLAEHIRYQLIFDFRTVDVYLQRVLMLIESGHSDKVNKRWLHRVLKTQQKDGGWADFQALWPVGQGRYFGFHAKGLSIQTPQSSFHATAQGVMILSLLKSQQRYSNPPLSSQAE